MVGGKGSMLVGNSEGTGGGGTLVPVCSLLRHAKVPPKGVGFCAACHPQSGCGILSGGRIPTEGLPPGIFP